MLSDKEKISLNRMKLFARSSDLSVVTAKDMNIVVTLVEKQSKEIEELNLKNEKLYEDNLTLAQEIKEFIEGTNDVKYYSTSFIKNHYISKDKIKAKIEEYDKTLYYAETEEGMAELKDYEYDEAKYGIKVLQSLLEKE